MGDDGHVGDPVSAGYLALQLDGRSNGRGRRASRPDDGERGGPRIRGGRTQEKGHQHGVS